MLEGKKEFVPLQVVQFVARLPLQVAQEASQAVHVSLLRKLLELQEVQVEADPEQVRHVEEQAKQVVPAWVNPGSVQGPQVLFV